MTFTPGVWHVPSLHLSSLRFF